MARCSMALMMATKHLLIALFVFVSLLSFSCAQEQTTQVQLPMTTPDPGFPCDKKAFERTSVCGNDSLVANGSEQMCVRFVQKNMDYAEHRTYCIENRGDLVTIKNSEFNSQIMALKPATDDKYFIGLIDEESVNDLKWVDGTQWGHSDYQNFHMQGPTVFDAGDCVVVADKGWEAADCDSLNRAICSITYKADPRISTSIDPPSKYDLVAGDVSRLTCSTRDPPNKMLYMTFTLQNGDTGTIYENGTNTGVAADSQLIQASAERTYLQYGDVCYVKKFLTADIVATGTLNGTKVACCTKQTTCAKFKEITVKFAATEPVVGMMYFQGKNAKMMLVTCQADVGTDGMVTWALKVEDGNTYSWKINLQGQVSTEEAVDLAEVEVLNVTEENETGPRILSQFTVTLKKELNNAQLHCYSFDISSRLSELSEATNDTGLMNGFLIAVESTGAALSDSGSGGAGAAGHLPLLAVAVAALLVVAYVLKKKAKAADVRTEEVIHTPEAPAQEEVVETKPEEPEPEELSDKHEDGDESPVEEEAHSAEEA